MRSWSTAVQEQVWQQVQESIALVGILREEAVTLARAAQMVAKALRDGCSVIVLGDRESAPVAQYVVAELRERIALQTSPVVAAALVGELGFMSGDEEAFLTKLRRRVRKGDVVIGVCSSPVAGVLLKAIEEVRRLGAATVALTGQSGRPLPPAQLTLAFPSSNNHRLREAYITTAHIMGSLVKALIATESKGSGLF